MKTKRLFLSAAAALLLLPATGWARDAVIGWKNFQGPMPNVPANYFVIPDPPAPVKAGPFASAGWVQTNFPANPQFVKHYNHTGLECNYTIDVHPVDNKPVYSSLIIDGPGIYTGWNLTGSSANGSMFTLNDVHTFGGYDQIPAGVYDISIWLNGSPGTMIPSPDEYLQCKEVSLPPSQD